MYYDGKHTISFISASSSISWGSNGKVSLGNNPVTFNTWLDYHMIPTSRPLVAMPEVKTNSIEVPFRDGEIELSTFVTNKKLPNYSNRKGTWEFIIPPLLSQWPTDHQRVANNLHGLYKYVVLEDDPEYFYYGRVSISNWVNSADGSPNTVTLGYNLDPYKTKLYLYGARQKWDPFNFYTDSFHDYYDDGDEFSFKPQVVLGGVTSLFRIQFSSTETDSLMVPSPFRIHVTSRENTPNTFVFIHYTNSSLGINDKVYEFRSTSVCSAPEFLLMNRDDNTDVRIDIYPEYESNVWIECYVRSL